MKANKKVARNTKVITELEADRDEDNLCSDREEQEILEDDQGKKGRHIQNVDLELLTLTHCHAIESCLVAEDNHIFGNLGPFAQKNYLQVHCQLPCSSCLTSLPQFLTLQSSLHIPTRSTIKPTIESESGLEGESESEFVSQSNLKVQQHKPITKPMKGIAEKVLLEFAHEWWLQKDGLRFHFFPPAMFYSNGSLPLLLTQLHRIRNRETMAEVLMKWEFLESDGNTLFDVIKVLNQRFDIEHEKTRKKSNAKQKETNAWNKQIKAQKASKGLYILK